MGSRDRPAPTARTARTTRTARSGNAPRTPATLVDRPRLYHALDQAVGLPLTMLVSPAGTGKTTLLSAWAARSRPDREAVRWVAPHEHARLERHLLIASGAAAAEADELLRADGAHSLDPLAMMLPTLERGPDAGRVPATVVVDDAHLLSGEQLDLLAGVLRKRPDVVRLVLASRKDLALPRAELEVRGLAMSLRAPQLRFSDTERLELIRAHATSATDADVKVLADRAGDWAAALVLGARALAASRPEDAVAEAMASGDQPILDFLLSEVYATLPADARQVLISTFGETVITPKRAAVLSGNRDAGSLLSSLATDGVLVTAYAQAGSHQALYRCHPHLVELLRRRVASGADAETAAAAHRRAALHDDAHGRGVSAIQQAIAARDDDLLADLITAHGVELLCSGLEDVLAAAVGRLPSDAFDRHPTLVGVASMLGGVVGDLSAAAALGTRADDAVLGLTSPVGVSRLDDALRVDALAARLWRARLGWDDPRTAVDGARELLGGLDRAGTEADGPRVLASPARLAVLLSELGSAEVFVGDLDAAEIHVDEAIVTARALGPPRPR